MASIYPHESKMVEFELIVDLAVIFLIAAAVTLLFSWLKQPLILGYLVAGIILGPSLGSMRLVSDMSVIEYLADLGIVLLMFTLGLEFTLGRLRRIGSFALAIGVFEIVIMIGIGFWVGRLLGWSESASLLLGATIAMTSSAIIVHTMQEQGIVSKAHSQIIIGVSVVEDMAAVIILALIAGFGGAGEASVGEILKVAVSMALFFLVSVAIGVLVVPKLISRVANTRPTEVLLILSLSICFGLAVLSSLLGFSLAMGAFIAGMLVGESKDSDLVILKAVPIKEMFMAVFFITMGMMVTPAHFVEYFVPAMVILAVFMVGKTVLVGTSSLAFGFPAKTAFMAGIGMIAIGEFSFVISRAGIAAGMAGEYLYSIVVVISAITAFLLPINMRNGERVYRWLSSHAPRSVRTTATIVQGSLYSVRSETRRSPKVWSDVRKNAVSSAVDIVMIVLLAAAAKAALMFHGDIAALLTLSPRLVQLLVFIIAAALILPPLISLSRTLQRLIGMLARLSWHYQDSMGVRRGTVRKLFSGMLAAALFMVLLFIVAPFVLDPELQMRLSPVVFGAAVLIVAAFAWLLNRTVYSSLADHLRRDLFKERVPVSTAPPERLVRDAVAAKLEKEREEPSEPLLDVKDE